MGRPTSFFGMPVLDKRHGHNHAGFLGGTLGLIDLHCLGWVRFCGAFRADGGGKSISTPSSKVTVIQFSSCSDEGPSRAWADPAWPNHGPEY